MARKIIIDTDPGQDDAVAILMALASPELEVLGLTCVAGNVPVERTALNARKICALAGREDVPVFAGATHPLARSLETAEHVHGVSGLDGVELPAPRVALQPQGAVAFLIESLRAAEAGQITLCALGPLTNLALALRQAPDIAGKIREIVLMGGSGFEGGNMSPAAEFNIYVDPEAAEIVFGAGVPLVVLPLDATHQLLTTRARVAEVARLGPVGAAAAAWMAHFERVDVAKYGQDGAPLHDPCVIAYLLAPELFSGRRVNVEIEVASALTRGMTVVDWWGLSGRAANALFIRALEHEPVFALIIARLGRYSA